MNVDYFRYLVLAGNFLNFRLCEILLGARCDLREHGPLKIELLHTVSKTIACKQALYYRSDARELGRVGVHVGELTTMTEEVSFSTSPE